MKFTAYWPGCDIWRGWHYLGFFFFFSFLFFCVPEFVAKTQNSFVPDDRFDGFPVLSLCDQPGDALNPVRAVLFYLKRTQQFRPGCRCLFISTAWDNEVLLKNTISFWLCEMIMTAYRSSGREDSLSQYQSHEIWGIASTLLFKRNSAVEQVLKAGVWSRLISPPFMYGTSHTSP